MKLRVSFWGSDWPFIAAEMEYLSRVMEVRSKVALPVVSVTSWVATKVKFGDLSSVTNKLGIPKPRLSRIKAVTRMISWPLAFA